MARTLDAIDEELARFLSRQHLFFVATAPLDRDGHVNLSPKGKDTFRVLGERRVAYLDFTGSGNETSAHLVENGRITFMFCAFEGPPRIVRLYGRGRTVLPTDADWSLVRPHFGFHDDPGVRQIVDVDVTRVMTSCGFAVPRFSLVDERDQLQLWSERKGKDGIEAYQRKNNLRSLDGLPTSLAPRSGKTRA